MSGNWRFPKALWCPKHVEASVWGFGEPSKGGWPLVFPFGFSLETNPEHGTLKRCKLTQLPAYRFWVGSDGFLVEILLGGALLVSPMCPRPLDLLESQVCLPGAHSSISFGGKTRKMQLGDSPACPQSSRIEAVVSPARQRPISYAKKLLGGGCVCL